ncbi:GDP-mannose 4,6-dehydratase [Candidatus Pacearchaeota archaeon]|nr:GDP-mannose 4,6-dehydratase [Candidatus Pacearchaeota archaeon]
MDLEFGKIKGSKVLVTGGAGFVGCNLVRKMLKLGAKITIFVKKGKDMENIRDLLNEIEVIYGDLTNISDVDKIITDKDYIFHLAWQTDLKKSMENPVADVQSDIVGILNLLEACKKKNPPVKIIFASATTVIGLPKKIPSNEDEKENPLSIYEANKLLAEKYLQMYFVNYQLKSSVLRFSNIFGEYQKIDNPNRGVLNFMIGRSLRGEKLTVYGDGNFIRDYCYIQNYVDALIIAAISDNTDGKTYVLGSGEGRTFNEVVEKIKSIVESLTDKKVEITHVHDPNEHEINKRDFIADYSRFKEDTGWIPKISFDEGLRRTIGFYIHNT